MGYTTVFKGKISVEPPLNREEIRFLTNFSCTRRMKRKNGPYYCGLGMAGQASEKDIIDYNEPPDGQPGLWCQWVPTADGKAIVWNGGEKFYNSFEWMKYIIEHFLRPDPLALPKGLPRPGFFNDDPSKYPQFQGMIWGGHMLNGVIKAKGEERGDRWILTVKNNKVTRKKDKKK